MVPYLVVAFRSRAQSRRCPGRRAAGREDGLLTGGNVVWLESPLAIGRLIIATPLVLLGAAPITSAPLPLAVDLPHVQPAVITAAAPRQTAPHVSTRHERVDAVAR